MINKFKMTINILLGQNVDQFDNSLIKLHFKSMYYDHQFKDNYHIT